MKIYVAADHAGFHLKEVVKEALLGEGYEVEDVGATHVDSHDDYPDYVSKAAEKVSEFPEDRAILCAGSGAGEMMLANKYPNVRAALFYGPKEAVGEVDVTGRKSTDPYEIVRLSREHNDANVLSLAARFLTEEEALEAVMLWLKTPFSGEERHERRIKKIAEIEKEIHDNY